MIVKVKHILIIDDRSDCLYDGYEIWEKIQEYADKKFKETGKIEYYLKYKESE